MKVIVMPYDPKWPSLFEEEAAKIAEILKENCLEVHHIGSTSVPGLWAKPIIDIMPVVKNIALVDVCNPAFEALGYEPMGEFGIHGRRYFRKGGELRRSHHVHIFSPDTPEHIQRHLAFRDYLRAHADVAETYALLKRRLARLYPEDINAYMDGKDPFIKRVEQQALHWYFNQTG